MLPLARVGRRAVLARARRLGAGDQHGVDPVAPAGGALGDQRAARRRRPVAPGIGTRPSAWASRPPTVSTSSVGQLDVEQLAEVLDRQPGGDPDRAVVELLDRRALDVVLVGDLADDLLEDVLDGDQAGGAAVLVDDDRDVGAGRLHLAQQVVDRLGLGHEGRPARISSPTGGRRPASPFCVRRTRSLR